MSEEQDLEILIEQTDIDKELAKKLLLKYDGDIVNCIINVQNTENPYDLIKETNYEYNEEDDIDETEVEVKMNKENLEEYRKIVDNKDVIYNKIKEEKEEKKKKNKEKQEKLEKGEKIEEETPLNNEEVYYSLKKKNFTSIKVL